ncbi:uncharacterized protein LOC135462152 [Liolophura sinensis]|uniref:uncharacterized protein LOC135462152 n=1 Tax=Liolophura sinensis TaxID=3198878 RepID=UPI0031591731
MGNGFVFLRILFVEANKRQRFKMFTIVVICVSLALVHSQDATTAGRTHHPHHTHTQHVQPTHTPHPHSTHAPITDHTFSASNPLWLIDATHHALVMKTDSGCYGLHITPEQVTEAQTADGLLKLERGLLKHTEQAKTFRHFHAKGILSDEIKKACPTILSAIHEEH